MAVSQISTPEQPQADSSNLFALLDIEPTRVETIARQDVDRSLLVLGQNKPEPSVTNTVRTPTKQTEHDERGWRGEIVANHVLAQQFGWGVVEPHIGFETDTLVHLDQSSSPITVDVKTRRYDALEVLKDRVDMLLAQNKYNSTVDVTTEGANACNDLYILVEERSKTNHIIEKWATGRDVEQHAYAADLEDYDNRENMHIVDRADLRDWPIDWSRVVSDAQG